MTHPGQDPGRFAARWGITPAAPVAAAGHDVRLVRWEGVFFGPQEFPCQVSDYSVVAVHDNFIPAHTLLMGGREVRTGPIRPGSIQIVPAGAEAGGRCGAGAYRFTHVQLPRVLLARTAGDLELTDVELVDPAYGRSDVLLIELCRTLSGALASPARVDQLYADELAHLTTVHVLRGYASVRAAAPAPDALAGWRMKRVLALVEDTLPAPVGLPALAAAAGLSVSRFRAGFTAATGVAPSLYVMQCRIARARQALAYTDRSIAQIAADCGFPDVSHFTRRFHRLMGTTPARFRQARR